MSARTPFTSAELPIGTRLIDSTPEAMTMSYAPDTMPWAAKLIACWLLPHWRSTVTPGTDSGSPAARAAKRVLLLLCCPTCPTTPPMTSSTSTGSRSGVRSSTARIAWACRSTGWTSA